MKVISIEPLTRVEGRGRVDLHVQDGRLQRVQLALLEAPRLFEGLVRNRALQEIPALVCRICSICSAVHRIAAATALENALQLTIPVLAVKVRELLLLGGHIESHALHLFCLIYPDLRGAESILTLLAQGEPSLKAGLELKRLGNRIQEVAGGRAIHPVNIEVGGIVTVPHPPALQALLSEIEVMQGQLEGMLQPFRAGLYPPAAPVIAPRLTVAVSGEFTLQGDSLSLPDGRVLPADAYAGLLKERSLPWSNAKSLSTEIFFTGALARQEAHHKQQGREYVPGVAGIHANNVAQADEIVWGLERSRILIRELLAMSAAEVGSVPVPVRAGSGTSVIEAPRGILIHHYVVDDRGQIVTADIVTPTAINQRAIEAQLLADLQETPEAELDAAAQRIVRAFDPCISCAVHILKV
ncbi:MAG: nickel-dependent hydrogenase large subunit [Desulfuromonadales bacterium]|nr:nickel-dependent hydrogenase large subunit [Desulfuromonadales bacterium]